MDNLKKFALLICLFCFSFQVFAQNEITVTGTVLDEVGEPLIGATVVIKNQPGLGTVTDMDGNYKIKTGPNEILVISYIGYTPVEVPVQSRVKIDVELTTSGSKIEEVTIVGAGVQRKVSVVGAITNVDVETLKVPTSNLSNALAGNVAGIIAMQRSGEPGQNYSEFWIRGISTFGGSSSALVLVDGIERNFNEVNVEDIESFSVLKDASATAIYGQRGANGVIIITTKRGKEGKVNINFKAEYGIVAPSRMPEYVNTMEYCALANEASLSRYRDPIFSPSEMEIVNWSLDTDIYPNVDWYGELLKDQSTAYRGMLNLSGGGSTARYYISGAYYNEQGLYDDRSLASYSTNANYKRYNFRSNVDVNVTKTTILELGVGGWITDQNKPGTVSDHIWESLVSYTPVTVPLMYSNGLAPTVGASRSTNPYVLLNKTGYQTIWENKLETNIALRQNLDFITPGLNFSGRFSFDAYNYNNVNRATLPDLYRASKQRDSRDGSMVLTRVVTGYPLRQSTGSWGERRYYGELSLNYDRVFNRVHRVSGLLLYYQQDQARNDAGSDIFWAIPKRNLALSGRATYSYHDRYFAEFNFGYTGSENFEPGNRFGFFPAIAGGWLISNEEFVMDHASWLSNLKLRYSYGEVGNDMLSDKWWLNRFPYITVVDKASGYTFGETGRNYMEGYEITRMGTPNLTWEIAKKHNIGLDLTIAHKFSLVIDFFKDNRSNIFRPRLYMPETVGLTANQITYANVGKMETKGTDGTVSYSDKIGDFSYTIRGNFTYARSKVLNYDEAANALPYQMTQGYRWGQSRGLIALGLFKDQADIDNSPVQTFGDVLPGDIKYKDVNGDGKINDDDVVPIGYTNAAPELIYGAGFSAQWRGFDFNILFQGSGNCDFFLGGIGAAPFYFGEDGNVLKAVADPSNRWISREISGTPDTERQDVIFPRLQYGTGTGDNNYRNSTWWLRNSRYLRLKNIEVGYTIPSQITRKLLMDRVRVYFLGNNLCVWDDFGWWDPELAKDNGAKYPIQKNFTLGLTVSF